MASNSRDTHELSAEQVWNILTGAAITPLSEREHDVLVRTAQGATAREITDELGISDATVNTFRQRDYHKFATEARSGCYRVHENVARGYAVFAYGIVAALCAAVLLARIPMQVARQRGSRSIQLLKYTFFFMFSYKRRFIAVRTGFGLFFSYDRVRGFTESAGQRRRLRPRARMLGVVGALSTFGL